MKRTLIFFTAICCSLTSITQSIVHCNCTHPFPYKSATSHSRYASQYKSIIEDSIVIKFYKGWKHDFLKPGLDINTLIVKNDEKGDQKKNITTSEAISYGMIIEVLIAGYDNDAELNFNKLYRYARSHPSTRSKYLMAWAQKKDFSNVHEDSAVDGDIDIAYALLLAYKQWNDENFKRAADSTLSAILAQEVDVLNLKIIRGNASVPSDEFGYNVIRMSDFMPAEFRAFYNYTGQSIWIDLLNKNYIRYEAAQNTFSKTYGLFPEYLQVSDQDSLSLIPTNISKKVLHEEGISDGGVNARDNPQGRFDGYNSCRVPWRITTDFLINSDSRAKKIIDKINIGIRSYVNDSACFLANVLIPEDNLTSEKHLLNAKNAASKQSADISTIGPLCVSALVDDEHPVWRSHLLGLLTNDPNWLCENNDKPQTPTYYDSAIRMICLLLLSKNYWVPEN